MKSFLCVILVMLAWILIHKDWVRVGINYIIKHCLFTHNCQSNISYIHVQGCNQKQKSDAILGSCKIIIRFNKNNKHYTWKLLKSFEIKNRESLFGIPNLKYLFLIFIRNIIGYWNHFHVWPLIQWNGAVPDQYWNITFAFIKQLTEHFLARPGIATWDYL